MTDHGNHGGRKLSSANSRLDTANCQRCQRRKRLSKLTLTRAGWLCQRCVTATTNDHGEDSEDTTR